MSTDTNVSPYFERALAALVDTQEALAKEVSRRSDPHANSTATTLKLVDILTEVTDLIIKVATAGRLELPELKLITEPRHPQNTEAGGSEPEVLFAERPVCGHCGHALEAHAATIDGSCGHGVGSEPGGCRCPQWAPEPARPARPQAERTVNIGAITVPPFGDRWARLKAKADQLAEAWVLDIAPNGDTLVALYGLLEAGRAISLDDTRQILGNAVFGIGEASR